MLEKEICMNILSIWLIAQTYAQFNHKAMAKAIFKDLGKNSKPWTSTATV